MQLNLQSALTTKPLEPNWIIHGVIPASTIVLVAGDAGTGKSVLNLTEGLHVALGRPFLGFQTQQTKVLYFDEENSRPDLVAYVQRAWLGMSQPEPDLLATWMRIESFSLGSPDWASRMLAISKEWEPGLIYVDTATSALAIKEENDNAEAQRACQALRRIIQDTPSHPAVKVLKHAKVQSGGDHQGGTRRTIRGAKAWLGAVDQTQYHIKAASGRPRKDGLHRTILVPDKSRAFGLKVHVRINPSLTDAEPKGLILEGETFVPETDLMMVSE